MSDTFQYRRVLTGDEFDRIDINVIPFLYMFNRTPWRSHAPETVLLRGYSWSRDSEDLITTFQFGKPNAEVERLENLTRPLADFNDFDFGVLWEPHAANNDLAVAPPPCQ